MIEKNYVFFFRNNYKFVFSTIHSNPNTLLKRSLQQMNQEKETTKRQPSEKTWKQRPFPRDTLKEALKVAQTIQDQNNGEPMKRIFIADHLKIKPESSNFRYSLSSSYRYGLTKGSYKSEYIELTSLGAQITKPHSPQDRILGLQEAAQKPDVFRNIYERYRDAKLPSDEYFKNLLEDEFKVPREHVDECLSLLIENGRFTNIIQDIAGAARVVFETIPIAPPEEGIPEEEVPPTEMPPPKPPILKQIFIAHGKNKVPLEQLKRILDQFKVPYKVAIDEPHRGRPISQKVADIMKSCSSAIFIFTADEEYTDSEGNKTFKPSDNVVYELGAAGVLYDKNIVIFKEEEVTFASDFRDLGYINFERDNLQAKTTDLLKELIEFGLLKITPA